MSIGQIIFLIASLAVLFLPTLVGIYRKTLSDNGIILASLLGQLIVYMLVPPLTSYLLSDSLVWVGFVLPWCFFMYLALKK